MNNMKFTLSSLLVLTISLSAYQVSRQDPPNIILITADDLGIGRFKVALDDLEASEFTDVLLERASGAYSMDTVRDDAIKSIQNLTRLAKEGIYFNNSYAAAPWCSPSRLSLLTAQYPQRNRVWTPEDIIRGEAVENSSFLTQAFQDEGYATGIIGKWHLGNYYQGRRPAQDPTVKGFQLSLIHI